MPDLSEKCKNGGSHTYSVIGQRDNPEDPEYPVIVCPICMTRWFGHRDEPEARPLDSRLPAALRDAIILDQAERAFEIIENELGFRRIPKPPNAFLGNTSTGYINPGQSTRVVARPQTPYFNPTHFVTMSRDFRIDDIQVANRSQFIRPDPMPSEAFLLNVDVVPTLKLMPGDSVGQAMLSISAEGVEHLPIACSAFKWDFVQTAMDVIVVVTNLSTEPQAFVSWFLGHVPTREQEQALARARARGYANPNANPNAAPQWPTEAGMQAFAAFVAAEVPNVGIPPTEEEIAALADANPADADNTNDG